MSIDPHFSPPTFESDTRPPSPIVSARPTSGNDNAFWGRDGLQFSDILDSINPLQHIPIVSSIYRRMTGGELAPGARIGGGALFGGPIGFLSGVMNSVLERATGLDTSDYILAFLPGGDIPINPASLTVSAPKPPSSSTTTSADAGQAARTSDTPPPKSNTAVLAELLSDLRATSGAGRGAPSQSGQPEGLLASPTAAWEARTVSGTTEGSDQGEKNIYAVPLRHSSAAESGPTKGDGRRPGDYSAVELASILRAYQRAGDAAAPRELGRVTRVGG